MSLSPYNPSYEKISRAYEKVCESRSSARRYAYHCTDTDPRTIARYGFDAYSKDAYGFTNENQFETLYDKYLPDNPCFVSKEELWDIGSKYVIKIDITGLELFPDFGHLLDFGPYYEEPDESGDVLFWWKGKDWKYVGVRRKSLIDYLDRTGGYLASEDFTGEMSWDMIGTACVDGDEITADRIVEVNGEPFALDGDSTAEITDESEDVSESVYDDYNVDTINLLEEFKDDRERGIAHKRWNLIEPSQYAYALSKFVKEGPELFSFSERVLDDWIRLIVENTKEIDAITVLDGRDELNGGSCINHYEVEEEFPEEFARAYSEYKDMSERNGMGMTWARINAALAVLEDAGFYDWAVLPDGNPADSDNGVAGVREILENLDEDASPSDKIVAINRCMDVFHRRSDWSSAFIKGGKSSLDSIADSRRVIARDFPANESFGKDVHPDAARNMIRSQRLKSFLDGIQLDMFDNPMLGEGVVEKLLGAELAGRFVELGCKFDPEYSNADRIAFKLEARNEKLKERDIEGFVELCNSRISYNVKNLFDGIITDTKKFFWHFGGPEFVGRFFVTVPSVVDKICARVENLKHPQMEFSFNS